MTLWLRCVLGFLVFCGLFSVTVTATIARYIWKTRDVAPLTVKQPCMIVDRDETGEYVQYTVRCLEYTGKIGAER